MSTRKNIIKSINAEKLKTDVPNFRVGDTVRVHQLIVEGNKERVQIFDGVLIRHTGSTVNETITVRKVSYNVGVERVYPVHSPRVTKIEVKQRGHVRRARLYYLRDLKGKAAKIKQAKYKKVDVNLLAGANNTAATNTESTEAAAE